MRTFLKIVPSEWENASRDKREVSVAKEIGYEVHVIARKNKIEKKNYPIEDYKIIRVSTRPLNLSKRFDTINRWCSVFRWIKEVKSVSADVISCHDIIALTIGYLSVLGRVNKPILIYDSHEFELGRSGNRSRMKTYFMYFIERFLIKKVNLIIVVNEKIAYEIKKIYGLEKMPLVIRNIPPYYEINKEKVNVIRGKYLEELKVKERKIIIITHGMITENRGIERFIELVSKFPEFVGVVLGNGEETYVNTLKKKVNNTNAKGRVLFHEAVAIDELEDYICAADVSLILANNNSKSYLWSLPNKFFESIQAEKPIICGKFPQMEKIINKYQIGYSLPVENLDAIGKKIYEIIENPILNETIRSNLKNAKKILCWENEKEHLKYEYTKFYDCKKML